MRPGQQNRRGRGRNNNNNRKSQNPLMRSFESAGPDVKIRGTPSHIAEKYVTLARDALSSGDPVLAENYLQHAEHYNRIILTYREQMAQQGGIDPMGNGAARTHSLAGPEGSDGDEFDEDGDEFGNQPLQPGAQSGSMGDGPQPPQNFNPPQHQQRNYDNQNRNDHRQPRHDNRYNNNNRHDRNDHRYDRNDRNDRQDFRGDRNDRHDRNGSGGDNRYRDDRRPYNNGGDGHNDGGYRRRDRFQPQNGADRDAGNGGAPLQQAQPPQGEPQPSPAPSITPPPASTPAPQAAQPAAAEQEQPAFLRRPVRRPRREEPASEAAAKPAPAAAEDKE